MEQSVTNLDPGYTYTVKELAYLWNLSDESIRRIFEEEPGVLIFMIRPKGRRRRPYRNIRIPGKVALRVQTRMTVGVPA